MHTPRASFFNAPPMLFCWVCPVFFQQVIVIHKIMAAAVFDDIMISRCCCCHDGCLKSVKREGVINCQ